MVVASDGVSETGVTVLICLSETYSNGPAIPPIKDLDAVERLWVNSRRVRVWPLQAWEIPGSCHKLRLPGRQGTMRPFGRSAPDAPGAIPAINDVAGALGAIVVQDCSTRCHVYKPI